MTNTTAPKRLPSKLGSVILCTNVGGTRYTGAREHGWMLTLMPDGNWTSVQAPWVGWSISPDRIHSWVPAKAVPA